MKKYSIIIIFLFNGIYLGAQHSPYFYERQTELPFLKDEKHAEYYGKICFMGLEGSKDWMGNILEKTYKNHGTAFNLKGPIYCELYFNHSVQYYYNKYMNDSTMKKEEWNNRELLKKKNTYKEIEDKGKLYTVGNILFTYYLDDKEFHTSIYELIDEKIELESWEIRLWKINAHKNAVDASPQKKLDEMLGFEYYPLFHYLRDYCTPGTHTLKLIVYPGKIKCKGPSDHGPDIMCSGEIKLIVTEKDIEEMKMAGGEKFKKIQVFEPYTRHGFMKK